MENTEKKQQTISQVLVKVSITNDDETPLVDRFKNELLQINSQVSVHPILGDYADDILSAVVQALFDELIRREGAKNPKFD